MRAGVIGVLLLIVAAAAIAVGFSAFIVSQTHRALVLQFGEPVQAIDEPGLYWRTPFIQTVEQFDRRILDLQTDEQEVIASDQKRIIVDAFARYRINDPLAFYQAFRSEVGARQRLTAIVDSTIRSVLGRATFIDIVRNRRDALMKQTIKQVNDDIGNLGVEIVDVRIQARRPARGEQPGDLQADADGAAARGGRASGARQRAIAAHQVDGGQGSHGACSRTPTAIPSGCGATAMRNATASMRTPSAGTKISSPSTARCRPMTRL